MYAASSEHTRLTWTAHGYNVAYSDEIGHFEFCDVVVSGKCKRGGATDTSPDGDDAGCFDASDSLFVQVSGCIGTNADFDGSSYLSTAWPGTGSPRPVFTFRAGEGARRQLPRVTSASRRNDQACLPLAGDRSVRNSG